MSNVADKKVMTPRFRVSFPSVFTPKAFPGQEAKYSLTMLFPKELDLKEMKAAAAAAAAEKWGENRAKWPKGLRFPFRDGDEKSDRVGYEGMTFVGASSKTRPGLVNQNRQPIISDEEFYAGCFARATLIAYAYDVNGNKGVSFALLNVQKMADGDAFSGRRAAEDEFDVVEDESEDQANYKSNDSDEDYDI